MQHSRKDAMRMALGGLIVKNCDVWTPEHAGVTDVTALDGKVVSLEKDAWKELRASRCVEWTEVDGTGLTCAPGLVDIHCHFGGAGGEEAALFAGDLFRMYSRYCETQGWKVVVMNSNATSLDGYKEIVFTVKGEGAYGRFRFESGAHRVQRVPETEAQGRIHTSAATVVVFPEADEEDEIEIPEKDLRIDLFCAGGAGGQHVNKTESAVRMTHIPTGLVAVCQDERSQIRNREKCLATLKARILDFRRREEEAKIGADRLTLRGSGDRSDKIRTYNFPQNRLTDHRIGLTIYSLDRIIDGDLGQVLDALHAHDVDERIKAALESR